MIKSKKNKFIVVVECREAKNVNDVIIISEGEKRIVVDRDGFATSSPFWRNDIPDTALIFDSRELAEKFAKSWPGHPCYCKPKNYEIFAVQSRFRQVFDHFMLVNLHE